MCLQTIFVFVLSISSCTIEIMLKRTAVSALAVVFCVTGLQCQPSRDSDPKTDEAMFTAWARIHAIPFRTTDPSHDLKDMQPLRAVVGNARIVALGEATHGTREFFQLKHRMLEFLVTEMGFTVFSIEANMPEAYRLNDYVLHGRGDPRQLLKGMYFWTWDTQEVLDMILWMREFNQSGKGHVEFTGFDMQFPTVAAETVRTFVALQDSDYETTLWPIYRDVSQASEQSGTAPSEKQTFTSMLLSQRCSGVVRHFEDNKARYVAAGIQPQTVEWVIQNARIVMQYSQMRTGEQTRDRSMAENIRWIADHNPGAKLVVWAHNGHVSTSHEHPGRNPMVLYLKQMFGNDYINVGFAFDQGSFRAVDEKHLREFTVASAPAGTLDSALAATGIPIFALDLRDSPKNGNIANWLARPHRTRSIGAVYRENTDSRYWLNSVVTDNFSVLLFVSRTTSAHRNPSGDAKGQ